MLPLLVLLFEVSAAHQAALSSYKQHRLAEAVTGFEDALQSEKPGTPEYAESVLLLGQSQFLQSKYAASIPWLEKAVSEAAAPPEAAYMLGNAALLTRQEDKAVKAFAKLFQVKEDSAAAHLITARMMMHKDLAHEAGRQAQKALALDPRLPEAHFLLGEVAIFEADLDRAITELKAELQVNAGFAMAQYRLGDAYSRQEKWDDAMPALEKSVWLNSNFSGPYILLGKGYLKRKELANAEGVLRHALRLDPQNLSAHYLLAQTYLQEGRSEDGKKELTRWQELKGSSH